MSQEGRTFRGFTARSVAVSILMMLMLAAFIQFAGVTESWGLRLGTEPLPVPAIILFCVLSVVTGGIYGATRFRLLTQAEMLVVLVAVMIAAPLMAHGFWRYMLALPSGIVRKGSFEFYDSYNKKLWPHGPNLLDGIGHGAAAGIVTNGAVTVQDVTNAAGVCVTELVFKNDEPEDVSWISVRLPVARAGAAGVQPSVPYLFTMLARPERLDGEAMYFCRVYHDDNLRTKREVFASRKTGKKTAVQKEGFVRVGVYGTRVAERARETVVLQLGLQGQGAVALRDVELMDVSALENAYLGRKMVSAQEYAQVPEDERAALIVAPPSCWSMAGLRFIVSGYFPLRQWLGPLSVWSSYVVLLLTALFAVAVIMRRQWLQNERYPLPLAHVPFALLGDDRDTHHALPSVWHNRLMWAGFFATLTWCLMGAWRQYNPQVPGVAVNLALKPYLEGPAWGKTWDTVSFTISSLTLGIALFMELNVLISVVLGFLLFRLQYWVGHLYGLSADNAFPYIEQQRIGGYVAYAAIVLVFTRKYLWQVMRQAVRGGNETGEVFSPRTALILFAATFLGVAAWARWVGLDAGAMLLFFLFLVSVGFVAMKLRTECGTPGAASFPIDGVYVVPVLGGMTCLGADSVIFMTLASAILFAYCFFNVPGMQLELIEIGRRVHIKRRHVAYACILGVAGAMVIGGWVYFSSMYAIGAQNYPVMTGEFFGKGNFKVFSTELLRASSQGGQLAAAPGIERSWWGFAYAGLLTVVVAVLRQLFAGFWFHPIGVVLGATQMVGGDVDNILAGGAWGSMLLAWGVRYTVLKFGGAATVRNKLLPFASGIVLGTMAAYALIALMKYYLYFFHPSDLRIYIGF